MIAVYYSLVLTPGPDRYQKQWIRSVESLRRFNATIPVYLFLFNEPSGEILEKAEEHSVTVHRLGAYRDCLTEIVGQCGCVLESVPTLNKLLPLGYFDEGVSQLLYLDCDTFFFRDVATLLAQHREAHFYAREEAQSKRSVFQRHRLTEIDEDAMYRIAVELGGSPVPLYNTGVVLLNQGLHRELFGLRHQFLRYAWQLTLGARVSAAKSLPPAVKNALKDFAQGADAITYPSENYWLIDEVALSLTLGQCTGLSHDQFPMADVLQNGEFLIYRSYRSRSTIVHYFYGNEGLFLRDLGPPSGGVPLV